MTFIIVIKVSVCPEDGSFLTAIANPESKNGCEKSTCLSRYAVMVMPEKPIWHSPLSTAVSTF
jgi:hypothetical protein